MAVASPQIIVAPVSPAALIITTTLANGPPGLSNFIFEKQLHL